MHNSVDYRCAYLARKTAEPEKRRMRVLFPDIFVGKFVKVLCGNAYFGVLLQQLERVADYYARFAHKRYLVLVLDGHHFSSSFMSSKVACTVLLPSTSTSMPFSCNILLRARSAFDILPSGFLPSLRYRLFFDTRAFRI